MINLDVMIEDCEADKSVKTVMKLLNAAHNTVSGNRAMNRNLFVQGSDGNWYKLEVNLSGTTPTAMFTSVGRQVPTGV